MDQWWRARLETLFCGVLIGLVAFGTLSLTPVVTSVLKDLPGLVNFHRDPESVTGGRAAASPLPFETAGITTDGLRGLGVPVGPGPTWIEVDRSTVFPPGHVVTDAANDQMVLSARRARWLWDTGRSGLGLDVTIVEFPTSGWAGAVSRVNAGTEPVGGRYPATATVWSERGVLTDDRPYSACQVLFTRGRLWVVVQLNLGPDYLKENSSRPEVADPCPLAGTVAVGVAGDLPDLPDLAGWERVDLGEARMANGASLGVATVLTLMARAVGSTALDRGSRETLLGRGLRRARPTGRDVVVAGAARRLRLRLLLRNAAVAVAGGVGLTVSYFLTGALRVIVMFLIVAAVIVAVGVLWGLVRRPDPHSIRLPGRWGIARSVATSLSTVIVTAGVFLVGWAGIFFTQGDATIVQIVAVATLLAGFVLVGAAPAPSIFFRRVAMPVVKEVLAQDDRAPVLFLRSFQDDGLRVRIRPTSRSTTVERLGLLKDSTFEDLIAWIAGGQGPVIAIGQPGTTLQPLGAVRDYFDDDQWQLQVLNRINRAAVVVFVVGRSPGAQWELAQLRDRGALGKTIFVVPPVTTEEFCRRMLVLGEGLRIDPRELVGDVRAGVPLVALRIDETGEVVRYLADGRDDLAYRVAMDHALGAAARCRTVVTGVAHPFDDPALTAQARTQLATFDPAAPVAKSHDPFRRVLGSFLLVSRFF